MSAPTVTGSAYPRPVEKLVPQARELVAKFGEVPSRNRLMAELKIGAPKATAVLKELRGEPVIDEPAPVAGSPGLGVAGVSDPIRDPAHHAAASPVSQVVFSEPDPVADPQAPAGTRPAALAGGGSRTLRVWPVWLLAAPAFIAIWSGWVGLGGLTGFGVVHPLPGIWDSLQLNTAITLPIGVETYAAFALRVWLSGNVAGRARRFARRSAISSLVLGAAGQVAYHLMSAAGITSAPWPVTTAVACLPVAVLGMGAALAHLLRSTDH